MTDRLRPPLSVFTEITDIWRERPVRPFLLAWLAGSVAGAAPLLVLTVPMLFYWDGQYPLMTISLAFLPLWLVGAITLAVMLVFGIPATMALRHFRHESVVCYAKLGLIFGFLVPLTPALLFGGPLEILPFVVVPGVIAGIASAFIWGRWRRRIARAAAGEIPDPRTNPFHDLIH